MSRKRLSIVSSFFLALLAVGCDAADITEEPESAESQGLRPGEFEVQDSRNYASEAECRQNIYADSAASAQSTCCRNSSKRGDAVRVAFPGGPAAVCKQKGQQKWKVICKKNLECVRDFVPVGGAD